MGDVPQWRLTGDWFDLCRCRVPCGCTFAQAPDEGECNGILAWHIREGNYGDVTLDGFSVVGALVDEEAHRRVRGLTGPDVALEPADADDSQREALQAIWAGEAGGWPAGFAELIEELRGIEYVPIEFEIADDLGHWRVNVPGKAWGNAVALTGPTAPEGARVQVHNAPGAEVGPGQVATYATAEEDQVEAFGFKWSWPGRSSKHFPFDWSGPDEQG